MRNATVGRATISGEKVDHELILSIEPDQAAVLARHPTWAERGSGSLARRRDAVARYFDTPDFDLWQQGFSLCVQRIDRRWVQILAPQGSRMAGMRQFETWQASAKAGLPLVSALHDLNVLPKALLETLQAKPLACVFTVHGRRQTRSVWLAGGGQVEVALVHREVQCGAQREAWSEVALRMLAGDPKGLFVLAQELLAIVPVRIGNPWPAERGYALCQSQPVAAVKADNIELSPGMSVQQALYAIVGNCVAQVQANEAGVVTGNDPEFVHQMRVGLRRLNSALGLFRRVLTHPPVLREDLDWIRGELGAARDWEVLALDTLGDLIEAGHAEDDLPRLQQMTLRRAARNRRRAAAAVQSDRYTHALLALGAWAQAMLGQPLSGIDGASMPEAIREFSAQVMVRRNAQLHRRGKRLKTADEEARHEMRLSAKKLRYAAEFFRALYPVGKLRAYIGELAALQEVLGQLNDAAVADVLLRQVRATQPDMAQGDAFVRGYLLARNRQDIRRLARLWRRFRELPLPVGK